MLTYIRSLLIEKDGRVRRNISILFPCVCSCACPPWTLQFSVRVLTFLSLILECFVCFWSGKLAKSGAIFKWSAAISESIEMHLHSWFPGFETKYDTNLFLNFFIHFTKQIIHWEMKHLPGCCFPLEKEINVKFLRSFKDKTSFIFYTHGWNYPVLLSNAVSVLKLYKHTFAICCGPSIPAINHTHEILQIME